MKSPLKDLSLFFPRNQMSFSILFRSFSLICFVLCLTSASFAEEADEEVFDDKRGDVSINQETLDKAETAFFKGLALYRVKKFEQAAERFKTAHKLVPYRDLLFNIARSYEELKQNDQAVNYYRLYLKTKPIDETQIIHRMRQLGVSQFETNHKENQDTQQNDNEPEQIPRESRSTIDWLTWSTLGSGLILTGVGAYFGLSALDSAEQARNAEIDRVYNQSRSNAESEALMADVTLSLGLILVAGGTYLYFTKASSSPPLESHVSQALKSNHTLNSTSTRSIHFLPLLSEKMQGLGFVGRF